MCICSFSNFFLNASVWLLTTITVIFPLFQIFFVIIIKCYWMIAALDKTCVITCRVKRKKKDRKNWSILMSSQDLTPLLCPGSTVVEIRFQSIQTYLLFLWIYPFCRLILCAKCNFSSYVNFFNFCFANLFLKISEVFVQ